MKPIKSLSKLLTPLDTIRGKKAQSRKGDLVEYYAVAWLWEQGYEVFKNAGCSGPIDMIAMNDKGEMILIDVKTGQFDYKGELIVVKRKEKQIELGVNFLLFTSSDKEFTFVEHDDDNETK